MSDDKYKQYVVTLRFEKNPKHNPKLKKRGVCPVSNDCTDITGSHHSYIVRGYGIDHIRHQVNKQFSPNWVGFKHITRIEAVS